MCDRWRKFENFLADMGACPDGLTLDRIDNSGNYEPGNCRWTTWQVQYANRRSNSGELHPNAKLTADDVGQIRELNARGMTQRQLGERYGVSHTTIGYILQRKAWRTRTHAAGRSSLSLEL